MYNDHDPEPEEIQPVETPPEELEPAVKPAPQTAPPMQTASPPASKTSKTRRNALIGAGVAALLVICCCAVVVLGLLIDPFGWNLLDRVLGRGNATAEAMPADTSIYVGINLLNLTPAKLERLVNPFQDAIDELSYGEFQGTEDIRQEFENMLADELDLDFEQDIMSWIGQYIGFGLSEIEIDPYYGELQDAKLVISVEVRDRNAADNFIAKLIDNFEMNQGLDFRRIQHEGVDIFEVDTDWEDERWAIARSGSLMLISMNANSIKGAIDAQNGDSLADMNDYRALTRELPGAHALSFYLSGSVFDDIYGAEEIIEDLGLGLDLQDLYGSIQGMSGAVSITDAGLQFDAFVRYDLDKISEAQMELMKNMSSSGQLDDVLPANTILFLSGARLDLVWNFYRSEILEAFGDQDYDEMMAGLADEIGFNPETDLLPYLDGDYAISLVQSRDGMVVDFTGIELGLIMLAEVSNPKQVQPVVDQFMSALEDQGAQISDLSTGRITIYEAGDEFMDTPLLAVALGKDTLGIGTTGRLLEEAFSGNNPLAKSDAYRQAWKAFPGGISPIMYLDLQILLDVLGSSMDAYLLADMEEALIFLEPIEQIAMGSSGLDGDTVQTTLIIFLSQP